MSYFEKLILELMIRPNRNSHLFYSDVTAVDHRLKAGDENERESKLRWAKMAKNWQKWAWLLNQFRYSRLIEEINEDQLDDQMDDEGSGSDSENSEVQGSTDSLFRKLVFPKSFRLGRTWSIDQLKSGEPFWR